MSDKYRKEVIDPGDRASRLAKEACFTSHQNNLAVTVVPRQPGNFRGSVGFRWKPHILAAMTAELMTEDVENDGAGGKPQFLTLLGDPAAFWHLGWEIITMIADDFARTGRLPVVIANQMDVKAITSQNFHLIEAIWKGYQEALRQARLVNITGETAVMKHSITAFCDTGSLEQLVLTWGGTCLGLCHDDLYFDGSGIEPGMPIVGFGDPGYRCNGGTFFTNLLLAMFGNVQRIMGNRQAMDFVRKLTVPSRSYARTVTRLAGWGDDNCSPGVALVDFAGIAHITGGGVWGKFGELLPSGVGAELGNMIAPASVLLQAQRWSQKFEDLRLTDLQAYGTFHGGCGMLLVCKTKAEAKRLIAEAKVDGIVARVVGHTTQSAESEVRILSRFAEKRWLSSTELEEQDS